MISIAPNDIFLVVALKETALAHNLDASDEALSSQRFSDAATCTTVEDSPQSESESDGNLPPGHHTQPKSEGDQPLTADATTTGRKVELVAK